MARSTKKKPLARKRSGRSSASSDMLDKLSVAQEAFEAAGGISRNGPLFRYIAERELEAMHERFVAGDRYQLMRAIRRCAQHDLVMPAWVAEAYIRGFDAVNHYRAASWDAAFGAPLPKGAQLGALRKRRLLSMQIRNRVRQLTAMGKRVDWTALASEFHSNKTTLQDLYYGRRAKRLPAKSPKNAG